MKKKYFVLLLLAGCLMSCARRDCRAFSSNEAELCIPETNLLGSVIFLPEVGDNEVGFFIGESMASADRVIVSLTRRDYLCQSFEDDDDKWRCLTWDPLQPQTGEQGQIVKTYTSETEATWVYGYAGSSDADSLASCRSISGQTGGARCFTEGRYNDLAYSAIFYDPRPGGVLQVHSDVEEQIQQWDTKAR